jgi:hypothetical protein
LRLPFYFSFNPSIINLSVYPEQITGEHYCLLFFLCKMVDCSGGVFRMSIYILLSNVSIISKWLLFYLQQSLSFKKTSVSLEFYFGLNSIIFCSGDFDINGSLVFFPNQSYQFSKPFNNSWSILIPWIL